METWEKRLRHEEAVTRSHMAAGNRLTPDGGVLYFNGPKFFAALNGKGHSASHFDDCSCKKD